MDLHLKNKTAIVTGGTAGIGLAIVQALTAEGVTVTVPGRSKEKLDKALTGIANVKAIVADPATAEGVQSLIQQVPDTDILINNLGVYEPKAFTDITDADWLSIFETNVLSGVRLSRHYFPGMLKRNNGRVIFISSESGVMTPAEMIHYGVTKSSQLARSEGIVEFLEKISSIPNPTPQQAEKEFFEKHRSSSILQRLIESSEIASLVTFLASPLSSATNGAALRAEGGILTSIV
jgi:NAD(P)-dependent dehydrogenase (short-subunit alcohol dehydrogenase family)